MTIKETLKIWSDKKKLKSIDKSERTNMVYHQLDGIVEFYTFKRFKEKETLTKLFEIFENPKFIKALSKVAKEATGEYAPNPAITIVIAEFLERNKDIDSDVKDKYIEITKILLKPTVKKLKKETGLDEAACVALASTVPTKEIAKNPKHVGRYVQGLQRALMTLSNIFDADDNYVGIDIKEFNHKTLSKIIKCLFKKEVKNAILMSIALDRKSNLDNLKDRQKSIWNVFTYYLLQELEAMEKEELKAFLSEYVKIRKTEKEETARRTVFSNSVEDDYKNLHKAISKVCKKDSDAKKYL